MVGFAIFLLAFNLSARGADGVSRKEAETSSQLRILTPGEMIPVYEPPTMPGGEGAWVEGDIRAEAPYTVRISLPANYRVPPRVHPKLTHMLVTAGTLQLGIGDTYDETKLKSLAAGSFVELPANTPYFLHTLDRTTYFIYGMGPWSVKYLNPAEDPRTKRK